MAEVADRILPRFRDLIRQHRYVVSSHATEELEDDELDFSTSSRAKSSSAKRTTPRAKQSMSSGASRSRTLPDASSRSSTQSGARSSSPSTSSEPCAFCGNAEVSLRHVTRSYRRGATLLVIENIPMFSCPRCGESYFTAETLHEVSRIKAKRRNMAALRTVPVAVFPRRPSAAA
jgi:YgiT-type zinc finger domain-containing protein